MRKYIIKKTHNGFLIEFSHLDKYYNEENMRVALTLEDAVKIIGEDLKIAEEETAKDVKVKK